MQAMAQLPITFCKSRVNMGMRRLRRKALRSPRGLRTGRERALHWFPRSLLSLSRGAPLHRIVRPDGARGALRTSQRSTETTPRFLVEALSTRSGHAWPGWTSGSFPPKAGTLFSLASSTLKQPRGGSVTSLRSGASSMSTAARRGAWKPRSRHLSRRSIRPSRFGRDRSRTGSRAALEGTVTPTSSSV